MVRRPAPSVCRPAAPSPDWSSGHAERPWTPCRSSCWSGTSAHSNNSCIVTLHCRYSRWFCVTVDTFGLNTEAYYLCSLYQSSQRRKDGCYTRTHTHTEQKKGLQEELESNWQHPCNTDISDKNKKACTQRKKTAHKTRLERFQKKNRRDCNFRVINQSLELLKKKEEEISIGGAGTCSPGEILNVETKICAI